MSEWLVPLVVTVVCLLMIPFTFFMCKGILLIEEVLPRWAERNGYRILEKEQRLIVQGPFFYDRYHPIARTLIEDREGRKHRGWVRLPGLLDIWFHNEPEVCWDEPLSSAVRG